VCATLLQEDCGKGSRFLERVTCCARWHRCYPNFMHNKLHHRQNAGVSRTGQEQGEKRCAVQSELPSCANLEVEDTNCDPEHQDLQTLGVERCRGAHPDASRQAELRNTVLRSCRCTIDGYSGRADLYGTPFFHLFSTWKKVQ